MFASAASARKSMARQLCAASAQLEDLPVAGDELRHGASYFRDRVRTRRRRLTAATAASHFTPQSAAACAMVRCGAVQTQLDTSTAMLFSSLATHAAPTANTTLGPLVGATENVGTTVVNVFRGVPFAASTGGANRWRPPQPRAPWSAPRSRRRTGPAASSRIITPTYAARRTWPPRFACPAVPRALCQANEPRLRPRRVPCGGDESCQPKTACTSRCTARRASRRRPSSLIYGGAFNEG